MEVELGDIVNSQARKAEETKEEETNKDKKSETTKEKESSKVTEKEKEKQKGNEKEKKREREIEKKEEEKSKENKNDAIVAASGSNNVNVNDGRKGRESKKDKHARSRKRERQGARKRPFSVSKSFGRRKKMDKSKEKAKEKENNSVQWDILCDLFLIAVVNNIFGHCVTASQSSDYTLLYTLYFQFGMLLLLWMESFKIQSIFGQKDSFDAWLRYAFIMGNLAMGASLGDIDDYYQSFLLAFALSKFLLVLLYIKALRNKHSNSSKKYCIYFIVCSMIEIILSLLLSFVVSSENATSIIMLVYGIYYFLDQILWSLMSSIRVRISVRAWSHMIQRLSLLTMVMLAVLMVYLILSLNDVSRDLTVIEKLGVVSVASMMIYFLASLYMRDGFESWMSEASLDKTKSPRSEARLFKWFLLQMFHLVWFFCLLGFAIGMDVITDDWENQVNSDSNDDSSTTVTNCYSVKINSTNSNNNNNNNSTGSSAFSTTILCDNDSGSDSFWDFSIGISSENVAIFTISLFIACVVLNGVRLLVFLEKNKVKDCSVIQWVVCGSCTLAFLVLAFVWDLNFYGDIIVILGALSAQIWIVDTDNIDTQKLSDIPLLNEKMDVIHEKVKPPQILVIDNKHSNDKHGNGKKSKSKSKSKNKKDKDKDQEKDNKKEKKEDKDKSRKNKTDKSSEEKESEKESKNEDKLAPLASKSMSAASPEREKATNGKKQGHKGGHGHAQAARGRGRGARGGRGGGRGGGHGRSHGHGHSRGHASLRRSHSHQVQSSVVSTTLKTRTQKNESQDDNNSPASGQQNPLKLGRQMSERSVIATKKIGMSLNYEAGRNAIVSKFINSLVNVPSNLIQPWLTYVASPMHINKIYIVNTWLKPAFYGEFTKCVKAFPSSIQAYMPEYNDLISQIGESDGKFDKNLYIETAMSLKKESKKVLYKIMEEGMKYRSHIIRDASLISNEILKNEIEFVQNNANCYKFCCFYILPKDKDVWIADLKNNEMENIETNVELYDEMYKNMNDIYVKSVNLLIIAYNPGILLSRDDKEWKFEIYCNGELKQTLNGLEFKQEFHHAHASLGRLYLKHSSKKRKKPESTRSKTSEKDEKDEKDNNNDNNNDDTQGKETTVEQQTEDLINLAEMETQGNNENNNEDDKRDNDKDGTNVDATDGDKDIQQDPKGDDS